MNSIDLQYQELLRHILEHGTVKGDRTGIGTRSVFGVTVRHNMSEGFPLLTTKKMYWRGIVTELLWFLRGDTNIKFLIDNDCHIWDGDAYKNYKTKTEIMMGHGFHGTLLSQEEFINKIKTDDEFANKWGDLGPIYGKQWRNWEHYDEIGQHYSSETQKIEESAILRRQPIDQIANLINDLRTNPDSRRLMVNAWNVGELDQMTLPPCHYGFQLYTREMGLEERCLYWADRHKKDKSFTRNMTHEMLDAVHCPKRKISLIWNQRSADVFLGLPFNIASYGLLLHILAELVGMVPDQLIGNIGDAHIYLNHEEGAREQLTRDPYELPQLNINTEWWQTESGECGIGPFDVDAFLAGLQSEHFNGCLMEEDIQLGNYQSHPSIKAQLNN